MKNSKILLFIIFFLSLVIYYSFATRLTFKPIWALDYFNPLAESLLNFRLDLPNPGSTHDLLYFQDKWYTRFGPLSALFLIPFQLIKGRYIPIVYLSVLFASLTVSVFYFLLLRIKKNFLPDMSISSILCFVLLFALGTAQFYVGTLSSVWHVDQIISTFFGTLGIYFIFKKKPSDWDYFFSSFFISLTLLGRVTIALLFVIPLFLYFYHRGLKSLKKFFLLLLIPLLTFTFLLCAYNYARFQNATEYGYKYINEDPSLEQIRKQNGVISVKNIPSNAWYMFLEIPKISFSPDFHFDINLKGNSIIFLTPAFLVAVFARPFTRKGGKLFFNPYISAVLCSVVIIFLSILLYYSSGWMQFGYRYTLDFTVPLLILCVFAMKGKVSNLFVLTVFFSIIIYILGITSLW